MQAIWWPSWWVEYPEPLRLRSKKPPGFCLFTSYLPDLECHLSILIFCCWRAQTHKSTRGLRDLCWHKSDLVLVFLWENTEQKPRQVTITLQALCQSGMLLQFKRAAGAVNHGPIPGLEKRMRKSKVVPVPPTSAFSWSCFRGQGWQRPRM